MNSQSRAVPLPATLYSLQAGRALASLAVVLHHASLATADFVAPPWGSRLFEAGYLGVDFFFVLSGFIIFHSTVGRGKSVAAYASARFFRVYPSYWPIGIGMALLYTFAPGLSAGDHEWSWLASLTLLPVSSGTALTVAWTLKHEILFYAVFGILYFSGRLFVGLALWCAVIVIAAALGGSALVPLSLLNLEFLAGVLAAFLARRGHGHPAHNLVALLPFLLWLHLGALREQSVLVGLSFALVILATVRLEQRGKIAVPRWLIFLGAASYSTYLVHGILISLTARLIAEAPTLLFFASGIMVSIVGGIAYHLFVERPVLNWRRGAGHEQRRSAQPSAAGNAAGPIDASSTSA